MDISVIVSRLQRRCIRRGGAPPLLAQGLSGYEIVCVNDEFVNGTEGSVMALRTSIFVSQNTTFYCLRMGVTFLDQQS